MELDCILKEELKGYMQHIFISVRYLQIKVLKVGYDNSIEQKLDFRNTYSGDFQQVCCKNF